jgi:putative Holliday junction resolvase
MAVVEIEEIPALLKPGQTIAGLDLGTKTIGLDAQALLKALETDKVGVIVIGLPMNMDGTSGPRVQATRAFVRTMQPLTDLPFVFWDERLSTVAAERALIGMDVSRGKRAERIDSAAAAFILQGALDRLHLIRRSEANDDYDAG